MLPILASIKHITIFWCERNISCPKLPCASWSIVVSQAIDLILEFEFPVHPLVAVNPLPLAVDTLTRLPPLPGAIKSVFQTLGQPI